MHPITKEQSRGRRSRGGETIDVTLALDATKRVVRPPSDFVRVLKASPPAWERWQELSYTQREYVEAILEAKRPEIALAEWLQRFDRFASGGGGNVQ